MSFTVDTAFAQRFADMILALAQEEAEGWRNSVRERPIQGAKAYNIDRGGGVEMTPITSRHADTVNTFIPHSRRKLTVLSYGLAEIIDDIDEVQMLVDPQSFYTQQFAKAWNRRLARTITTAMLGNALAVANDDSTTNVALPAGQQIANGGTNMTLAKLRQANRILDVNGFPRRDRHIAVSPFAIEKLLSDSQFTSGDFNSLGNVMSGGDMNGKNYYGFQWHITTDALGGGAAMADPILPKSGNIRTCIAWYKDSVTCGISRDLQVEVPRDPTLWNNRRPMVKTVLGAVRNEDEGVVSVAIDESA